MTEPQPFPEQSAGSEPEWWSQPAQDAWEQSAAYDQWQESADNHEMPQAPAPWDQQPGPPPPPVEPPVETGLKPRRRVLPFMIGGTVLLGVSLFAGGIATGWLLNDEFSASRESAGPEFEPVSVAQSGDEPLTVPDVRGLASADAMQVLVDSGFEASDIQLELVPWAGEPGVVVSQDPVVGQVLDNQMILTVSELALMPALVGKPKADAIKELSLLGAQAEVVEEFRPTLASGTVISQDLEAGAPLPLSVRLTVAQAGSSMFLSQLPQTDDSGRCGTRDVQINGQSFTDALQCSTGWNQTAIYAWALGRHATLFSAVAGISDSSAPTTKASLTVFTDGNEVYSTTLTHGSSQKLDIDLTGVLRLEVRIAAEDRTEIYLADALIKGTTTEIELLTDAP